MAKGGAVASAVVTALFWAGGGAGAWWCARSALAHFELDLLAAVPALWLLLDLACACACVLFLRRDAAAEAFAPAHELAQARFDLIFNALVKAVTGRSRPGIVDQFVYGFLFAPVVGPPVVAVTYGAAAAKAGGAWAVAAVAVLDRVAATHPELASNVSRAVRVAAVPAIVGAIHGRRACRAVAMYAWALPRYFALATGFFLYVPVHWLVVEPYKRAFAKKPKPPPTAA